MRNANNQPVVGILAVTRRPVYSHWIDDVCDASQPYTDNKQLFYRPLLLKGL